MWERHIRAKRFGAGVDLVGRDEEMANLQSFLEYPEARALVVRCLVFT